MLNKITGRQLFLGLLFFWFVLNFFQAFFSEINEDEAYYALYGQHLSWGYFDHPPLVALVTHVSAWFFSGNLGGRFVTVLLQIPTLILVWLQLDNRDITNKQSILFFFLISASLALFAVYGFITTPDVPLLFFTALFLYVYKQFISTNKISTMFWLAVAMAGMIYSKYQGVLIIGFVMLSNIRLLANPKFYLAGILALLLCLPHFYWQFSNGFPSITYQLISRSRPFEWRYLWEYVPNQLAVFNPFTLGAIVYVLVKHKSADLFERAQHALIAGFLIFFGITTLRGHVEPQWTVSASVPAIVLLHNRMATDGKLYFYIRRYVGWSMVLIFISRFLLAVGWLPKDFHLSDQEPQYTAIQKVAGNRPVVFTGSYQNPSLYTFFTGYPATVISSLETRQTQFDIWHFEKNWSRQPVFIKGNYGNRTKLFTDVVPPVNGFLADSLQTTNRLQIVYNTETTSWKAGDVIRIKFKIENPTQQAVNFESSEFPVVIVPVLINKKGLQQISKAVLTEKISVLLPGQRITNEITFTVPELPEGTYHFGLSCRSLFGPTLNSAFKDITLRQ